MTRLPMDSWAPPLILAIGAVAGWFIPEVSPLFPICIGLGCGFLIGRKTRLVAWLKPKE